ncbi:hypothetical protein GIW70_22995 [Pseudomonas syringae]|nr:hypothetical protein [Pseudomonas syringae]MCF5071047.1 hypothetical protein [Pseudomonas syringae]
MSVSMGVVVFGWFQAWLCGARGWPSSNPDGPKDEQPTTVLASKNECEKIRAG